MTSLARMFDDVEKDVHESMKQLIAEKSHIFLQNWHEFVLTAVKRHVIARENRQSFQIFISNWSIGSDNPVDSDHWRVMMKSDSLREAFIEELRKLVDGKYEVTSSRVSSSYGLPIIMLTI